jgi:hypothetical protein
MVAPIYLGDHPMLDLAFLALGLGGFAAIAAYAVLCNRI